MAEKDKLGFIDYDYIQEIENARMKDVDGDLGYTIHIRTASEIAATIEAKYIILIKQLLDQKCK